jgi:hypothetical protein
MGARPPRLDRGTTCSTAGAGPPEMASTPCPLRILTRCPAPGGVRPPIAAGKTILGGSGRASVPDPRQQGAHHGRSAATCRASGSYHHGGGVRSGVCLREWVPVLARGNWLATWIRLLGSEGRDLAWPFGVLAVVLVVRSCPRTARRRRASDYRSGRWTGPLGLDGTVSGASTDSEFTARLVPRLAHRAGQRGPGGPARLRRRRGARGVHTLIADDVTSIVGLKGRHRP